MAHGIKPYGRTEADKTIFGVQDMGELVARLDSIVTFDRRGNVVWLDDFESGLAGWERQVWGLGGAVEWSSVTARSGDFSCLLTAGSDDEHAATITHYFPTPVLSRLGFEFSFTYSNPFDLLGLDCIIYLPDRTLTALIRYVRGTMTLQYRDAGTIWRDIASPVQFFQNDYLFNTMKLVVDVQAETYVRLLVNDASYSLANIPIERLMGFSISRGSMAIYLEGRDGFNDIMYVDDAIITQNEP